MRPPGFRTFVLSNEAPSAMSKPIPEFSCAFTHSVAYGLKVRLLASGNNAASPRSGALPSAKRSICPPALRGIVRLQVAAGELTRQTAAGRFAPEA